MLFTRSTRRLAACIAAVFLLACQSAAFALACCGPAPAQGPVQDAPCHDAAAADNTKTVGAIERCQPTSPSASGANVPAADGALVLTASARDVQSAVDARARPADPPLLRVGPPPHAILHCCLRN